ncbi:hypothetical protein M407DRAFT_8901 [Tulasnella calospora MUT 4182]|uniref:Uncharacterized protein n=1 Tax=Tulasnella calospora MUT 4182 TaxID=1051891 RepID=A0A0C3Q5V4_9AGAM|nr:hypothetical protein M407DRAFT_8901 [Tulasnella calospora MUT 4182]
MLPEASLEALRTGCYCSAAAMLEAFNACLTKHSSSLSKLAATFPFDDHVWAATFSLTNLRDLEIAPLNVNAPAPPSEEIFCKIRTLVERHPLLRKLHIALACKQSIAAPPPEQVPISALQILDVENSPDPEASRGAVVAYLAAVLPHGAHVHDWGFGPLRSFWRKVAIDLASGGEPDQPGDSEESTEEESTEESSAEESSTEESSTEEESAGEESAEDDTAP